MSDRTQRAVRAHELLEDKLLKESFDAMRQIYTTALRACTVKDDMGRLRYAMALDVIDGVTRHLEAVLVQGKLDPKQSREFQTPTAMEKIARIF